jgi:type II secretion system (T2SS) protein M
MTTRDRLVVTVIAVLAVLVAAWLLVVSPERKRAAKLQAQVSAASSQLAGAQSEAANARQAQARYAAAYASVVALGKAVPPGEEVPSLIYQLAQASNGKNVDFASIQSGSGSGAGAGGPTAAAGPAAAGTAATGSGASASRAGGLNQMPFTFVFNGTFPALYKLFQRLNGFTVRTASGQLQISGRLLTIQAVKLAPATAVGSAKTANGQLTGTITATAYVLPASQGLTGGASPSAPAGTATTTASTGSGASSPSAPAIARVTP